MTNKSINQTGNKRVLKESSVSASWLFHRWVATTYNKMDWHYPVYRYMNNFYLNLSSVSKPPKRGNFMRIVFLLCLCLIATSVHADDGRWIVDKTTGCKVWSFSTTSEVKSVSWSGECDGGIANGQGFLKLVIDPPHQKYEIRNIDEVYLKNGKVEGQGTITWEMINVPPGVNVGLTRSGKTIGEFKDGKLNGKGTSSLFDVNGKTYSKYDGEFKDGKKNGKGTLTRANGSIYVGEFKDHQENGKGTFTWANGDKLTGEFKDGEIIGKGTIVWADGNKYTGGFKNLKLDGEGTLIKTNGDQYVGEFKDDKMHGKGKFIFKSGSSYEGLWENGERIKIF